MATLREKVDAANEARYQTTEEKFQEYLRETVIETINDNWRGSPLRISISKELVRLSGELRSNIGEYINVIDRACTVLNSDPYLVGFDFKRSGSGQDSDGVWGSGSRCSY